MRPRNFAFWLGSVAIAGLFGTASTAQPAPKSETAPCFNLSCPRQPVGEAPTKDETGAPDKPYDWKASFAAYTVGKVPRTADGKPDLQGIWSRSVLTPLERRGSESDKTEYDPSVRAEFEDAAQQRQLDLRTEPTNTPPGEKTTDAYNTFWRDGFWSKVPMTSLRTSQVVDPPNGRLPPLTPAAREKRKRDDDSLNRPATGPEDRPLSSRCVRPIGVGPAFTGSGPGGQESTLEIIQNPQAVVVRVEALRSQLIYLDGRPRPPANVLLETGAARGHWDGDTLVVEYTNFAADANGTAGKRLTERWKRLDDTHLLYGFTMDDPGTRTKPYSVEFVMWRLTDQEQLVEYACHEGNVGLEFTLSGARAKEREEEEQQEK
ncbi:MAG TPA: hypothetical protein VNO32_02215 [Candidatus Acidoferrum sp.]|nr:hypothetical protein [Candidatus Acidoferrum sp.]